jgi:Kef-type K+ transport system membrane component KefB
VVFLGRSFFPFVPANTMTAAVVAMVFGAIAVANSPTVAIAVIAETESDGPLTRTVLGVTILKDVCVIVLFAVALAIARDALGGGDGGSLALTLARELGGSVIAGIGFGVGISLFLRYVDRDVPVFILALCFGISQVAAAAHLEALLVALTAGVWVENFSRAKGEKLIAGIERVSLPVYALFFAAAGAKVDLGALAAMWPLALVLTGARGACIWGGTLLGAVLSNVEPEVRRHAWLGFISQAGVSLALAAIVARAFPSWGAEIQILIVAMIGLHELIGPIGFQFALKRAGEIGKAAGRTASAPPPERDSVRRDD